MLDEEYGRQDRARVSRPARASAGLPHFAAPITHGRPAWQRRHRQAVFLVDMGVLGGSPILYLLWLKVVHLPLVHMALAVVVLSALGRCVLLGWLLHLRRKGRAMSTMLAVGTERDVARLIERTRRRPALGWRIDGACTSTGLGPDGTATIAGVPVVGDLDTVAALALAGSADAVAVAPCPGWTMLRLQHLACDLDGSRTALLVDPRLVPRVVPGLRIDAVDGLPLLRLAHREPVGSRRLLRDVADRVGSLLLIVLLAPVLAARAAVAHRDGGPVLERRSRVGRGGREFSMLTFRTAADSGTWPPVGFLLRCPGLDQLAQLFNVLAGSMALVGPQPGMPGHTENSRATQRRQLLKPGILHRGHDHR